METRRRRPGARGPDARACPERRSRWPAEALIAPADPGSRLDYTASVDVRIPLVGGRIESYIAGQAGEEIGAIHRFTGDWIAENR